MNYFEYFLILISATNGFVLIFAFASLVGVLVGLAKFCGTIKNFVITARIKTYKSAIKMKRKTQYKIVLLGKANLDSIEAIIFKALTDLYICRDKLVSVNNVIREYNETTEEVKNLQNAK